VSWQLCCCVGRGQLAHFLLWRVTVRVLSLTYCQSAGNLCRKQLLQWCCKALLHHSTSVEKLVETLQGLLSDYPAVPKFRSLHVVRSVGTGCVVWSKHRQQQYKCTTNSTGEHLLRTLHFWS